MGNPGCPNKRKQTTTSEQKKTYERLEPHTTPHIYHSKTYTIYTTKTSENTIPTHIPYLYIYHIERKHTQRKHAKIHTIPTHIPYTQRKRRPPNKRKQTTTSKHIPFENKRRPPNKRKQTNTLNHTLPHTMREPAALELNIIRLCALWVQSHATGELQD